MYALNSTELQIWFVNLAVSDSELPAFADVLSADERERAARFRFEKDRRRFTVCRGTLRMLLQKYLGCAADTVQFEYASQGKPRVSSHQDFCFNVSHSGDAALMAFTRGCELGVDLEHVREIPELTAVASRFFAPEEYRELVALPLSEQKQAFFQCWTRKEAYIKATGEGLLAQLDQFQVTVGEQCRFVHINHDIEEAARWTLQNLELKEGYVGAVAYRAPARRVQIIVR
jgi:4'-phosphopantetheinyl transferase